MASIRYRALNKDGHEVEGHIEAPALNAALDALHAQGLLPFDAAIDASGGKQWWNTDIFGGDRMSNSEQAIFARELATLVDAELPLDEALQSIADQSATTKTGQIAKNLTGSIHEGVSLSGALHASKIFSASHRSIIQAGEAGGALGTALTQIADFMERENKIRGEIQSALFYPVILLIMAGAAVVFILTVLLPSLQPIFDDADAKLPATTAALINLGVFIKSNWAPIITATALASLGGIYAVRREGIRQQIDKNLLRAPLLGAILAKTESARINRTLGMLLKNGVTMTNALHIVSAVASNLEFKRAISEITRDVKEGQSFLATYKKAGVFPPLATRLAAAGDRSGKLDVMLLRSAEIFDDQVKRDIDRLVGLLTPVLTLTIGFLVGGLVISVLTAILSVNDLAF
jgi:general secretion pathway protein F